jgi:hypothetical protein
MFVNDTNPGPLFFDAAGAKPPFLDARRAIVWGTLSGSAPPELGVGGRFGICIIH